MVCDVDRILADVHALQSAFNRAANLNIPAELISEVKIELQNFLTENPVLSGSDLTFGKITGAEAVAKGVQEILDKIDYDVEIRALPFQQHRQLTAPITEAKRIADDLVDASLACRQFTVPVEFSFI